MKTVVGLYNNVDQANKVKSALTSTGFASQDVTVIDQSSDSYRTGSEGTNPEHETVGGKIKHFFSSMTGSDDAAHDSYTRGVSKGGVMVAVKVPDEQAEQTADLLEQYGASEIEGGYGADTSGYRTGSDGSGYGSTSAGSALDSDGGDRNYGTGTGTLGGGLSGATSGAGASTDAGYDKGTYASDSGRSNDRTQGEQVIPVVEEELTVGKRQVQRGVRIYSHVVEEPVSQTVNLRDERIVVDRRPVDRAATEADFNPGEGVVEVTATGEEAVIGKRSRVVEEVVVGKQTNDRTEEINETVRRTEVDVQPTATDDSTGAIGTSTTTGTGETVGSRKYDRR